MDFLTSTILSGLAFDAIKKGVNVTTGYLKNKLTGWVIDEVTLKMISDSINNIPAPCCRSSELIKAHLDLDEELQKYLKNVLPISKKKNNWNIKIGKGIGVNKGIAINNSDVVISNDYVDDAVKRLKIRANQSLESQNTSEAIQYLKEILDKYNAEDSQTWWMLLKIQYLNFQSYNIVKNGINNCVNLSDDCFWDKLENTSYYKFAFKYADDCQKKNYLHEYECFKNEVLRKYRYLMEDIQNGDWNRIEGLYVLDDIICKIFSHMDEHYIVYLRGDAHCYRFSKLEYSGEKFFWGKWRIISGFDGKLRLSDQNGDNVYYKNILSGLSKSDMDYSNDISWEALKYFNLFDWVFNNIFWEKIEKTDENCFLSVRKNSDFIYLLNPFKFEKNFKKFF